MNLVKVTAEYIDLYLELQNRLAEEDPYIVKETNESFREERLVKLRSEEQQIFILVEENINKCEGEGQSDHTSDFTRQNPSLRRDLSHKPQPTSLPNAIPTSSQTVGFIVLVDQLKHVVVERIYLKPAYRQSSRYGQLLRQAQSVFATRRGCQLKYIGVNGDRELAVALKEQGFGLVKEHLQMEKEIVADQISATNIDVEMKSFARLGDPQWVFHFIQTCMDSNSFNYQLDEIRQISQHPAKDCVARSTTSPVDELANVFYHHGAPIGFVIAQINEARNRQQGREVIYLEEVALHPAHRGQGYGTQLVQWVINQGMQRGMEVVRLHVYRDNSTALRLYQKLGFVAVKGIGHWVCDFR